MDEAKEKVEYLIEYYSQKSGPQVYAILLKDGTYIGHVQAVFMDDGSWEIGYHVRVQTHRERICFRGGKSLPSCNNEETRNNRDEGNMCLR